MNDAMSQAAAAGVIAEHYEPVQVSHAGPVTIRHLPRYGVTSGVVLAPVTSANTGIEPILARDPLRVHARLMSAGATATDVIICTTLESAQAMAAAVLAAELGALTGGAYLPANLLSPDIYHQDPVWAVNTSTTAAALVAVWVERSK